MPPRTILPPAAAVVVATLLPAGAAGAAGDTTTDELPEESHCVLRIVGTDADGADETAPPDCYPTLAPPTRGCALRRATPWPCTSTERT